MSQSRFSIVLVGVSALLRRPLVSRLRPAAFTARGSGGFRRSALPSVSAFAARRVGLRAHGFRFSARTASEIAARRVGLRAHGFRFSARTASELPSSGWFCRLPLRRLPLGGLAFGLRFRGCHSAGWPSGSRLPLFGTRRFGVAARRVGLLAHRFRFSARTASGLLLGGLAFGLTASAFRHAPLRGCPRRVGLRAHGFRFSARAASEIALGGFVLPLGGLAFGLIASAFRHAPLRRLQLGELAFGLTTSAFRHAPLRSYPRRVGLRAHGFRFSARTDPHRRTAEARADGAHRHDTCFTSKHLSQHVNLPHRSPQALQNRQTPLLSPTRHPCGRRPHAHHRTHREEVHPGFGRREGRGRRTRGRDHRQSPTGTQRATRRPGLFPSHPPLLGGRGLVRTGGRGADQAGARGVPPLVAHSPRPLREGSRRELRAARQKEARRQRATGRFAHGWRYAGSTRAFDGLLGRGLGCDASGHACACASLDGNARGYTCACRAFAHDVDYHGYARTFDGLLGRGLGCDASGYACTCTSLDGNARGYTCACRAFDGHSRGNARACRAFDGHACRNACACHAFDGYACCERNAGRRGSLTLAHGATPCLRPLRRTAFRLAPHPAERDSAGATCIIIACTAPVSASV